MAVFFQCSGGIASSLAIVAVRRCHLAPQPHRAALAMLSPPLPAATRSLRPDHGQQAGVFLVERKQKGDALAVARPFALAAVRHVSSIDCAVECLVSFRQRRRHGIGVVENRERGGRIARKLGVAGVEYGLCPGFCPRGLLGGRRGGARGGGFSHSVWGGGGGSNS